ncbi:unnamed protein product [Trichogramma brassicae]|uniref:Reverse transcriptase domain-containing protein n=1 Tax=Trichogramma brassicae TaxID=86971 RepID=A0A6H5IN15_9HYME|nr:unnamed protein product [Trichogramma brassicae]
MCCELHGSMFRHRSARCLAESYDRTAAQSFETSAPAVEQPQQKLRRHCASARHGKPEGRRVQVRVDDDLPRGYSASPLHVYVYDFAIYHAQYIMYFVTRAAQVENSSLNQLYVYMRFVCSSSQLSAPREQDYMVFTVLLVLENNSCNRLEKVVASLEEFCTIVINFEAKLTECLRANNACVIHTYRVAAACELSHSPLLHVYVSEFSKSTGDCNYPDVLYTSSLHKLYYRRFGMMFLRRGLWLEVARLDKKRLPSLLLLLKTSFSLTDWQFPASRLLCDVEHSNHVEGYSRQSEAAWPLRRTPDPISLLSELSKIVERIIHTQLSEYLSQSGLLDPGQHGFRPGHSTTTALLEITERARRAIDRREVSVLVSFDFSKAFDTIDHTILIRKLICSGCSDCVIEWFVSYLSGRSVCVRLEDGTHTEPRAVTSGVPQGSVLAPLLFSIFIADLPTCLLNSRHIIYADDTQIISHGLPANIGDLLRDVTRDANAVCEWATTNGLTCNAAKTKVMLIGSLSFVTSLRPSLPAGLDIGGEIVPFSEEIKTLGVFLSGKFNWDRQIAFMTTKVHHSLYALRFYKHALSRKMRLMLVGALVTPHSTTQHHC